MQRAEPGLAFTLVCELGFSVGVVTHRVPRLGAMVWVAEPVFENEPDAESVGRISGWRWPVLFPADAALRRRIIAPVAVIDVPRRMVALPLMRSGDGTRGWRRVRLAEDGSSTPMESTDDRALPIYQIVNDTRLREMIVSGWTPEQQW